jgi:hypothetical protein
MYTVGTVTPARAVFETEVEYLYRFPPITCVKQSVSVPYGW